MQQMPTPRTRQQKTCPPKNLSGGAGRIADRQKRRIERRVVRVLAVAGILGGCPRRLFLHAVGNTGSRRPGYVRPGVGMIGSRLGMIVSSSKETMPLLWFRFRPA